LNSEAELEVIIANLAGFCYGVRRAVDTVTETAEAGRKPMYILGPLIHNPQVVERLEERGVKSVDRLEDVPEGSIVVMPSHGVPRRVLEQASEMGLETIDLTCPFVSKIYQTVAGLVTEGYQVIVVGDKGHTEVRGIMSVSGDDAIVVSDPAELINHALKNRVGVVAQTTQRVDRFTDCVSEIAARAYEVRAFNTICHATTERQREALETADGADAMVVVGGRNSANTRRLAEICSDKGIPTHHVETADEIDPAWFAGMKRVGVTAGASTPDWIIGAVVNRLEEIS